MSAPEPPGPDSTRSGSTGPDTTGPDTTGSDATRPHSIRPDSAGSDSIRTLPSRTRDALVEALGRLSLRWRVGVLAALVVGLAVAVSSGAAYLTVSTELRAQTDEDLLARARAAVNSPLADPTQLVQVPAAALGAADVRIALLRGDGVAFSAEGDVTTPLVGAAELEVARGLATQSVRTARDPSSATALRAAVDGSPSGERRYRVVAVPIRSSGFALVLAQPTDAVERMLGRLGLVLLLVGVAGIALAASGGLAIARAGLRPVQRLTAAAEHVARTEELAPVGGRGIEVRGHDELARLAGSFNAMLAALARSRERQQRLVADAGHELRTPLTSLRTNLDLLAQSVAAGERGLSPADRDELLADVRAQVEELSVLVGDLVELARDDPPGEANEPVEWAAVCERALERVRRRAPGLRFDAELEGWQLRGDATALERAVANLLDNAAKWSPPGGTVTVRLRAGELSVADQGPGIAEADLPHVFERFYRASEARTLPGSGLGLAIVRQVAARHGGTVSAGPAPDGGTLMTLRLPGDPTPPAG